MSEMDSERRGALMAFFREVGDKLSTPKNTSKSDWRTMSKDALLFRLAEEVLELQEAIETGKDLKGECCDVAAFAFFIWDVTR